MATVPIAALAGRLSLTQLLLVALLGGGCTVIFRTAYPVFVAGLVPPAGLERANSRLYGAESVGHAAGPSLAGTLTQFVGAAVGITVQVIGLAVSTVCLLAIGADTGRRPRPPAGDWREQVRAGLRQVFGDRFLRPLTIVGGIGNFGHTGMNTLIVVYLATDLALPPATIGVVLSIGMIGGVVGALLAPRASARFGSGRLSMAMIIAQLSAIRTTMLIMVGVIGLSALVLKLSPHGSLRELPDRPVRQ